MSIYFVVGEREIWNPATRAGVLFYDQLVALEKLAEQPCGVTDSGYGDYQIVPATFSAFIDALLAALGRTNHAVLGALAENTLAVALGIEARVHRSWRALPEGPASGLFVEERLQAVGPIQVGSDGAIGGRPLDAKRLQSILERAQALEHTFAGGEPAPRA